MKSKIKMKRENKIKSTVNNLDTEFYSNDIKKQMSQGVPEYGT